MATIKAFKGLRPSAERAAEVAALPYDVYSEAEARALAKDNPYSFLHIDRPEVDFPECTDPYEEKVYLKARENLDEMIRQKILIQDEAFRLYIYRLIMDGKQQTGLCACAFLDEYIDGTIKRHEVTRHEKELDRIRHIEVCNANTGPIFLCYRTRPEIKAQINNWANRHAPVYDFTSEDQVRHTVWVIDDETTILSLQTKFNLVENLYIADGHHRNEAAAKVAIAMREKNPSFNIDDEFNFYEVILFPDDELNILPYNRVVKDLNGYSAQEFLDKVAEKFTVEPTDCGSPQQKNSIGMFLEGQWKMLTLKEGVVPERAGIIDKLDVSILQKEILEPLLGIKDVRSDSRIDFVGGIRQLEELEASVNSGEMKVAFVMFPTSMEELFSVCDSGGIMPPKSTWFEPKPRSGLFIHKF